MGDGRGRDTGKRASTADSGPTPPLSILMAPVPSSGERVSGGGEDGGEGLAGESSGGGGGGGGNGGMCPREGGEEGWRGWEEPWLGGPERGTEHQTKIPESMLEMWLGPPGVVQEEKMCGLEHG